MILLARLAHTRRSSQLTTASSRDGWLKASGLRLATPFGQVVRIAMSTSFYDAALDSLTGFGGALFGNERRVPYGMACRYI